MYETNWSVSVSIYDLSREKLTATVPTIVCTCVLAVVGLVGNVFVVVVFGFKMKKRSTYRHFILVLAVYDLVACGIGMPVLTVELAMPYLFNSRVGCKMLRYGFHIIAGGTSLTHLFVGVDRYRRVCRSTDVQMSVRSAKLSSFLVITVSVFAALPVPVMYDIIPAATRIHNVTGSQCDISTRYSDTLVPIIFHGILSVFTMIMAGVLIMLYSLIGRKICKQIHIFQNVVRSPTRKEHGLTRFGNVAETGNRVEPVAQTSIEQTVAESVANEHKQECETAVQDVNRDARVRGKSSNARQKRSREMLSRKMTFITFAIMVVYIVSFFPLEVLVLVTLLNSDIEREMSFTQLVFYRLGYHSYILNNVANPLVYLFMDVEFRRHCKEILANMV